jgi:uncharacterized protein YjiS (DUF1127 family)
MTSYTDSHPHRAAILRRPLAGLVAFVMRLDAAYDHRRRLLELTDETLADVGIAREDLTGASSYQKELPFFLQPGYDRRH